eukprot:m.64305 g.64305  ORF g.64305 m.64305 type:complete len:499 (+) comp13576_c0_seq2:881-2377(+)
MATAGGVSALPEPEHVEGGDVMQSNGEDFSDEPELSDPEADDDDDDDDEEEDDEDEDDEGDSVDVVSLVAGLPDTIEALADETERHWQRTESHHAELIDAGGMDGACMTLRSACARKDECNVARAARAIRFMSRGFRPALDDAVALGARELLLETVANVIYSHNTRGWAAAALTALMWSSSDDKDAVIPATRVITQLLDSDDPVAVEGASGALVNLSNGTPERKNAVLSAGAVVPLMRLLRDGDPHSSTVEQASAAIRNLAAGNENCARAVADEGALDLFATMMELPIPKLVQQVAGATLNLIAGSVSRKRQCIELNMLPTAVRLVSHNTVELRIEGLGVLRNILAGPVDCEAAVLAVDNIVDLLVRNLAPPEKQLERAVGALRNICTSTNRAHVLHVIEAEGAVAALATVLHVGDPSAAGHAACCLEHVVSTCLEAGDPEALLPLLENDIHGEVTVFLDADHGTGYSDARARCGRLLLLLETISDQAMPPKSASKWC